MNSGRGCGVDWGQRWVLNMGVGWLFLFGLGDLDSVLDQAKKREGKGFGLFV